MLELTEAEVLQLAKLLKRCPQLPNIPIPVFKEIRRLLPMPAVEVPIIRTQNKVREVLLTPRTDEYAYGMTDALHFPGGLVLGEDCDDEHPEQGIARATARVAAREVGIVVDHLIVLDPPLLLRDAGYNTSVSTVAVVDVFFKEPAEGEWVAFIEEPPARLIPVHRVLWRFIYGELEKRKLNTP